MNLTLPTAPEFRDYDTRDKPRYRSQLKEADWKGRLWVVKKHDFLRNAARDPNDDWHEQIRR